MRGEFSATISAAAQRIIDEMEQFVEQRDDAWAIPRVTGEFLHLLVLANRCKRALEIGTSYGFSGLWLGTALAHNGGGLITLDVNPAKTEAARQTFARAGLDGIIAAETAEVKNVVGELLYDFVFIDAIKEQSVDYFEAVRPHLAPRAVVVADNATSHAEQMAAYVRHVHGQADFVSGLIQIGSGLELSVRLG